MCVREREIECVYMRERVCVCVCVCVWLCARGSRHVLAPSVVSHSFCFHMQTDSLRQLSLDGVAQAHLPRGVCERRGFSVSSSLLDVDVHHAAPCGGRFAYVCSDALQR